jgi:hypothetical protein
MFTETGLTLECLTDENIQGAPEQTTPKMYKSALETLIMNLRKTL